jgi:hypothetical protein
MKFKNNKTPKIKGLSEILNISRYDGPRSEMVAITGETTFRNSCKDFSRSND